MITVRNFVAIAAGTALLLSAGCRSTGDETVVKVINGVEISPAIARAVVVLQLVGVGSCTGTFLNDTTVITAGHCVDLNSPSGNVTINGVASINAFYPAEFKALTAAKDTQRHFHDIALLVFPDGTGSNLGLVSSGDSNSTYGNVTTTPVKAGDQVTLIGYGATNIEGTVGAGPLRIGNNTVLQVDGDVIDFTGTAVHPAVPTGQNASASNGDSGGPMLDSSGDLVGITEGGAVTNGQVLNIYISTTGALARTLFVNAIQCRSGPCARNFVGSGVDVSSSPVGKGVCTGKSIGNECWYRGAKGNSCDNTCAANGATFDLTASSVGPDICIEVGKQFGVTNVVDMNEAAYPGIGCAEFQSGSSGGLFRNPATQSASNENFMRFCACR